MFITCLVMDIIWMSMMLSLQFPKDANKSLKEVRCTIQIHLEQLEALSPSMHHMPLYLYLSPFEYLQIQFLYYTKMASYIALTSCNDLIGL